MTIKALYPTVRPTLNLDFAKTKALDPRVTFTRASTGTFVGANGLIQTAASDAARFDHNPVTGESLGLLVEEARTNLMFSSEFPPMQNSARITYATGPSLDRPDGTVGTVAQLTTNTFGLVSFIRFTNNVTGGAANTSYTGSMWIRTSTGTADINIKVNDANLSYGSGNFYTVTTGWQRIATTGSSNSNLLFLDLTTSSTLPAGTVFYIWGAQLEAGAFPTSYIPTVASTVTRAADVANITGANFSSWYNATVGTFYASVVTQGTGVNHGILRVGGVGSERRTQLGINIGSLNGVSMKTLISGTHYTVLTGSVASNARIKTTAFVSATAVGGATNGSLATTTATPGLSTDSLTTLEIGRFLNDSQYSLNGTISRLAYYPVRLPDAQLQALTAT